MKNINILPIFVAMNKIIYCLFLSLLISCVKSEEPPSFGVNELVFVGDASNEARNTVIRAAGDWSIDDSDFPDWLSISPLSGFDQDEITVTILSVNDTGSDRSYEVAIVGGGILKVVQQSATTDQLTDGMLAKNIEGYYSKGEALFAFDPVSMQIGINPSIKSYLLTSDDQKKILSLTFSGAPVLNEAAYISVQSRGLGFELSETMDCRLYKQQDGKLWFYNPTQKRGFITREIK